VVREKAQEKPLPLIELPTQSSGSHQSLPGRKGQEKARMNEERICKLKLMGK
jgi:hypothetical protein